MIWPHKKRDRDEKSARYASRADFQQIFTEGLDHLYRLSYLLTRDHKKAEVVFVAGLEDCVKDNAVFAEWARSWAKRTIIVNAIRELRPIPSRADATLPPAGFAGAGKLSQKTTGHFELKAVSALEDFERFVFVIAILEHYSDHDCALLLGCTRREIEEARARALEQVAKSRLMLAPGEETQAAHG